ncbi:MAG: hypothetical protein K2X39_03010 [Silvanigrellaceae bacterium]|nr:hypothetical protein [Silvanigrellaceae bacterium]
MQEKNQSQIQNQGDDLVYNFQQNTSDMLILQSFYISLVLFLKLKVQKQKHLSFFIPALLSSNEYLYLLKNFDVSRFYQLCTELCTLEASSFISTENKETCEQLKSKLEVFFTEIEKNIFKQEQIEKSLSYQSWRLFIGSFVTFAQWCFEVGFFDFDTAMQMELIKESPLETLAYFSEEEAR